MSALGTRPVSTLPALGPLKFSLGILTGVVCAIPAMAAAELTPEDLEFFESRIRPLLIENCYECHSVGAERVRGGFLLDSQPAMLRGGESGPSFITGAPEESRLINMVRHHPDFESMPPKSKLSDAQIADLITWIDRGAPDPRTEEKIAEKPHDYFDLEERKQWWSLQPITNPTPPEVTDASWPANDYDSFILAKLEEKEWAPAEAADRRSLLRRLSFDLIGLPPTPEELNDFLTDQSEDAYARQVDRLLSSPHFGEKWARHWMDLTRYAETKAFEMDYTMPHAYRYRDYLIQAFNEDVPYDQFIMEALAGDLLAEPRRDPNTGDNESIKGPGFLFLSDGQHGPPDIHEDEARIFARTIDVTSKAFLGSTVACARCHDHKFDAITTADYYSLYGILRSSRIAHANTVHPDALQQPTAKIRETHDRLQPYIDEAIAPQIELAAEYLKLRDRILNDVDIEAAIEALRATYPKKMWRNDRLEFEEKRRDLIIAMAEEHTPPPLDPYRTRQWLELAVLTDTRKRWPELMGFQPEPTLSSSESDDAAFVQSPAFQTVVDRLGEWQPEGPAFDLSPSSGEWILSQTGNDSVFGMTAGDIQAGHRNPRFHGALRSPDFILDGEPIRFQAKGRFATIRLIVRNYELAGRGPTTAILGRSVNGEHWHDFTIPTYLWAGEPAYLEIIQHGQYTEARHPNQDPIDWDDNGYVAVRFNSGPDWQEWWANDAGAPLARLEAIWQRAQKDQLTAAESEFLSAVIGAGLVQPDLATTPEFAEVLETYRAARAEVPRPRYARTLIEGDPQDVPVYIRGSHKNLSPEPNPRRFLDGLGGPPLHTAGSGRLEWAQYVADPENPLTARVIVNRVWSHVFGQGLVTTVNDLGVMGSTPSHPELLDYLAQDLIRNGWSLKSLIREMVMTQTYRMSTTPSRLALEQDPDNRLLQHMSIRRLDAEAVRDHLLATSGTLDPTQFGESVAAYVATHPDSRAKPKIDGPIDGDRRRSVYLEIRRNFLPPLLTAFDLPNATEPIGVRHSTNVPAQSLALMNDPFVHQQAEAWAELITANPASLEERINQLHLTAFARPATETEQAWAADVLTTMADAHGTSPDSVEPWKELCHLMFNRKEFIYLL